MSLTRYSEESSSGLFKGSVNHFRFQKCYWLVRDILDEVGKERKERKEEKEKNSVLGWDSGPTSR